MDARKLRHLAEYGIFSGVVFLIQALPVAAAERMADTLAWVVHRLPARLNRRHVAEANLRSAFGDLAADELNRMIIGMWQHLFRMVCEIVQMRRRLRLETSGEILDFRWRNECVQALLSGRRVICLGGHFGNWEISVNALGHFGFPMGVIVRDLDNPWLHRWFQTFRESSGNWMISKNGGGPEVVQSLESCGMVSLLCDQDAGPRGVFVDFFGQQASTFKSIALLALQYDALVVVGGGLRIPRNQSTRTNWVPFLLATETVIDTREFDRPDAMNQLTQRFTSALEDLVRRAPEQYFWVHRRWKSEPRTRRRVIHRAA